MEDETLKEKEVEVMPGVFLTDFRSDKQKASCKKSAQELKAHANMETRPQVLLENIKEIENSVFHMKRSNREMQEFIDQAPDDDLVDAIAENNTILTRKEAELVKLKEFYAQITGVKLTPAQTQPPAAQTEVKTPATSAATEVNTNDDVGMFL